MFSLSGFCPILLAVGAQFWHTAGEMKTCRRGQTLNGARWQERAGLTRAPCTYQVSPPWGIAGDMQGEAT